jgi:TusA-related sulfurtransferase
METNEPELRPDYFLDITNEVCPMTFVKAKLLIERMKPGETAEIMLKGIEPLSNVPRSIAELGFEILSKQPLKGESNSGVHRLYVKIPL